MRRVVKRPGRAGAAAIWALVVLSVLTVVMTIITWQSIAGLRLAERRQNQLQADWLARSGVELAAARLLAGPDGYQGETVEPLPRARVRIEVKTKDGAPGLYHVTCEARYPADDKAVVVRSVARTFRRVAEKDRVRLEVVVPGEVPVPRD